MRVGQPALAVTTNVSEIRVGEDTPVRTTVTTAIDGTKAQGATIHVSGAGVSVPDQTTDSNGTATFSVNASTPGTISVEASGSGFNNGTATINVTAAPVNPTVGDFDNPAADTTGNGKLNNVNGDANYDILDVVALYANLNSDPVQNNPDRFNFNSEGGVDILDVVALYSQLPTQ